MPPLLVAKGVPLSTGRPVRTRPMEILARGGTPSHHRFFFGALTRRSRRGTLSPRAPSASARLASVSGRRNGELRSAFRIRVQLRHVPAYGGVALRVPYRTHVVCQTKRLNTPPILVAGYLH